MRRTVLAVVSGMALSTCYLTEAPAGAPSGQDEGILEIVAVDGWGGIVETARISVARSPKGEELASGEVNPARMLLPYGDYHVSVAAPGFRREADTAALKTGYVVKLVTLAVGHGSPSRVLSFRGQVVSPDVRAGCDWIRAVPLFVNGPSHTARITGSGHFAFADFELGTYAISLFGRREVCATGVRAIAVRPGALVEIRLDPAPNR